MIFLHSLPTTSKSCRKELVLVVCLSVEGVNAYGEVFSATAETKCIRFIGP